MKVLVTGSNGLIGSEAVRYYDAFGHQVIGIDNNMRAFFFGPSGDTTWNLRQLQRSTRNFTHYNIDIRNRDRLFALFEANSFDFVIHCAAQPSHDRAREIPLLDFEVNALGTVNMLEAARRWCPDCVFILMSTNKVYGDSPNELRLVELDKRYDYARPEDYDGIDENCRIDQCLHSLFGSSKLSADIVAQEYGRYFGMKVGIFRGGCLTGPAHSAVELHGFLSYLVKVAMSGATYRVHGYQGKQVRDNIHSCDVIQAFEAFRHNPHPGEVYNLGGGRQNSVSIQEAFVLIQAITGRRVDWTYIDKNRVGDHICYITNLSKFKSHYPQWTIKRSVEDILRELVAAFGLQRGDSASLNSV